MARGWRRAAELVLARSGLAGQIERRARPATLILAYHNVVPSGEDVMGDASLHLDQATFADQLDFVLEKRTVIALDDVFHPAATDDMRTRVAITFDDAYSGTMTAGLEELSKRGLPSTVFVPPGLLGSSGFWWDRLATPEGLDESVRATALGELQGKADRIFDWAQREGLPLLDLPSHARPVDAEVIENDDLGELVTLGAHTWGHPNLTALEPAEADDEMRRSRTWLESRTQAYVDWLAYPYGFHEPTTVAISEEHFSGAVLVSGGRAISRGQAQGGRHRVPRLNVPRGLSLEGLALRLSGLLAYW